MGSFFNADGIFSRALNTIGDIILISIMWLIGCLPIITIGTSTTAAYYAMIKSVRKETGYVTREFFRAYKENFVNGLIFTLASFAISALLAVDVMYLKSQSSELNDIVLMIIAIIIVGFIGFLIYLFPVISRFTLKRTQLVKLTLYMEFRFLPRTIISIVILITAVLGIYLFLWAIFFIPGVVFYIYTWILEPALKKNMPVPEEGSEEAEKWYYK